MYHVLEFHFLPITLYSFLWALSGKGNKDHLESDYSTGSLESLTMTLLEASGKMCVKKNSTGIHFGWEMRDNQSVDGQGEVTSRGKQRMAGSYIKPKLYRANK